VYKDDMIILFVSVPYKVAAGKKTSSEKIQHVYDGILLKYT